MKVHNEKETYNSQYHDFTKAYIENFEQNIYNNQNNYNHLPKELSKEKVSINDLIKKKLIELIFAFASGLVAFILKIVNNTFVSNTATSGKTKRFCDIPICSFKELGISFFKKRPWNGIGHFNPAILRSHGKPQRLVEVQKIAL